MEDRKHKIQDLKDKAYRILEKAVPGDELYEYSRAFDKFILTLIVLNVAAVILETVQTLSLRYGRELRAFEVVSVTVFSIEYLLRVWACTSDPRYRRPLRGRLKFVLSPMALVDLAAILPFYVPMVVRIDLRFIRALRLFRLFRLLKVGRYSDSVRSIGAVLRSKKEELVITVFVVSILLTVSASVMYFVENQAQPDQFSSIPASMWWGMATLTTVGYGDVYPVTPLGKAFAAIIAMLGIGMFALPAGIFASGFEEEIKKRREGARICPHCGRSLEEDAE
jgi:voltage-gated potassium channel